MARPATAVMLTAFAILVITSVGMASPGALSLWFGGAFRFITGEAYILVNHSSSLNPTSELTILAWINGTAVERSGQYGKWIDDFNTSLKILWNESENVTIDNQMAQLAKLKARSGDERGLVLSLHFDEGSGTVAHDSSGYQNHGTLVNGPTWTTGKFGKALRFDGVNDWVSVPDSPSLDITKTITIEAWVNWQAGGVTWHGIVSKGHSQPYGLTLNSPNKYVHFEWKGEYYYYCNTPAGSVSTNVWHHIVATYDRSKMRVYVDGVKLAEKSLSDFSCGTNNEALRIGLGNNGEWFRGMIDEVRIYNRALSEEEIRQHYLQGAIHYYNGTNYWETDNGVLEINESNIRDYSNFQCSGDQCNFTIYLDNDNYASVLGSPYLNQTLTILGLQGVTVKYNASDGTWRDVQELEDIGQGRIEVKPSYVTDSLVSYWSFDERSGNIAVDSYGSNNGTIHGATRVYGKYGYALKFGVDD